MCNESRKSFFAIISRSTSDIGDLGLVLTGSTRAIQQKKIAEIGSLDREIIFRIIGSGRVGPPKIVIRSDPFGTLVVTLNHILCKAAFLLRGFLVIISL